MDGIHVYGPGGSRVLAAREPALVPRRESPPAADPLPRLLAGVERGRTIDLAAHTRLHGELPSPATVIDAVERSGLRGRGGARFPTARKLRAVAAGGRALARPTVVVNGMEGEPAAAKDRLLLDSAPHLVLDGAALAAAAVGAREVIVCVPRGALATQRAVAGAIAERGADALVRVAPMEGGYVASEETALVQQLGGGPPVPAFTPPRPFERGVRRRPTLIDNTETLAHVALIARHGGDWFRQLGTASDPGSMLITLSGGVARPGVYEIAAGTRLKQLVAMAGGLTEPVRALLVGGYFGSWIDGQHADALVLAEEGLRPHRAALGAGVVVVLPESACGPAESARVGSYLAGQSAGQCGPCVNGLAAIAGALAQLVEGAPPVDTWTSLRRWLAEVPGRGACRFPDGATRFVASALEVFEREYEDHARHGPCEACLRPAILPRPRSHEVEVAA
jgi:NADH:ubiquinone oxidoreductase subunit F (NADH-binding)